MARSVHLDWFTNESEQELLSDLVAETISLIGHDCWYCPRMVENRDSIFREGEWHEFNDAFSLEFYVKTTAQMGGEGALLSKFGVELRDELVLTVAMKTFSEEVLAYDSSFLRPREGDVIYVPMIGALFTIKYVDKKAFFYQMGDLQAYDLSLELYEASSSVFNTGVPEIDDVYNAITEDLSELALMTENGFMIADERDNWALEYQDYDTYDDDSQNVDFEEAAEDLIVWDERDPFSSGDNY